MNWILALAKIDDKQADCSVKELPRLTRLAMHPRLLLADRQTGIRGAMEGSKPDGGGV